VKRYTKFLKPEIRIHPIIFPDKGHGLEELLGRPTAFLHGLA
jgi:hypothetical protein